MLKLIADSGSTKTSWCLLSEDGREEYFSSIGLNPYFIDANKVSEEIKKTLLPVFPFKSDVGELVIHFYGAGCSSKEDSEVIIKGLAQVFINAEINVDHDLMGAARALCGDQSGIVGILGTGSSSCYYDGQNIIEQVPALSFILGDEGSGSHIGKQLITDFLYKEIPVSLHEKLEKAYSLSKEDILDGVYRKPFPNKFLASFNRFVADNIDHDYCQQLVNNSFEAYLKNHISKYAAYRKMPLNLVGSVAYHYQSLIKKVAAHHDQQLGKIIQSPIKDLVAYHKK